LTQGRTVHITGVHTKADDAPRELIHDHEHPVGLEKNGFATKQINTPETVFGMPDEGKPRRSIVIGYRLKSVRDLSVLGSTKCFLYVARELQVLD